jgi:hypothetical protein
LNRLKKKQFHRDFCFENKKKHNIAILGQNTHKFLLQTIVSCPNLNHRRNYQTKNYRRGDQTENEWKKSISHLPEYEKKAQKKQYYIYLDYQPIKTSRKLIIIIVRILEICF